MSVSGRVALSRGVVFVVFSAVWIVASIVFTDGDPTTPGPYGDSTDYDSIALNLARGRGFGADYSDPEFRRPYELHRSLFAYGEILARREPFHLLTYRPPLLPFLLSLSYRAFGRDFLVWRFIYSLITAIGVVFFCDAAWRMFGSPVALITAVVLLLSFSLTRYVAAEALMTEPLAAVMVALLVWALCRFSETQGRRFVAMGGAAFALLCLSRSFFVAWLPFLAAYLVWMASTGGAPILRALRIALLFVVVAVAVQLPWWIRNCVVTGAVLPLGAPEKGALHAAYSDLAVLHHGRWWMAPREQAGDAYTREVGFSCKDCDDVKLAHYQMAGARKWIVTHPDKLPELAWMKLKYTVLFVDEAGPIAPLFLLAFAAPIVLWRRRSLIDWRLTIAAVLFIALDFLVVMLTWTAQGWRFIVPVEPLIAMLAAVPLAAIVFGEERIRRSLARPVEDT